MFGSSLKWFLTSVLCIGLAASCGGSTDPTQGSESHFLAGCGGETCGAGLSCICGVCTRVCQAQAECDGLAASARCVELGDLPDTARCDEVSAAQGVCDAPCTATAECAALGDGFVCSDGVCRVPEQGPGPGPGPGPVPRCEQPQVVGPCNAAFERFWFNPGTDRCEAFIYGGCGANENNFETSEECNSTCGVSRPNACDLPLAAGDCDALIPRFWHDPATGVCQEFTYGGCSGNANNFGSLEDCRAACGPSPAACDLPADPGPCFAAGAAWYHNSASGSCEPFTYGGCQGNGNRFPTREACEQACPPVQTQVNRCSESHECKLVRASCCESCQDQEITDYVAVNGAYTDMFPPGAECPIELVDCFPCDHSSAASRRGLFGARCEAGVCVAYDLRETELGACSSDVPGAPGSCSLRAGLDCCPRCDLSTGISSVSTDFDGLLSCPDLGCPPCEPIFPPNVTARCDVTSGRCGAVWMGR